VAGLGCALHPGGVAAAPEEEAGHGAAGEGEPVGQQCDGDRR